MSIVLNLLVLLILPFFFIGFINKTKAFWSGRKGASVIQPLYDTIKLFRKGEVISNVTSYIFKISPIIVFSSVLFAGLIVPIINHTSIFSFEGDFLLFAYILAFGRFMAIISALDTGSSFEGMGANREVIYSGIIEPGFLILIASLCLMTNNYSFREIFHSLNGDSGIYYVVIVFAFLSLYLMLLVEGSRVPIDDPNTHLELTMIHEVMILDNSGPNLALVTYSTGMKMVVVCSLLANIIIPINVNTLTSLMLFIAISLIIAISIGCIESMTARLRLNHVPQFLFMMTSISLIILSAILMFLYGGVK